MTWEETIKHIRTQPEYKELVEKAFFEEDTVLNIERFKLSEEFKETKRLVNLYHPTVTNILDIGCGNGISSVAFALEGYQVTAVEPDKSETIGAGAIRRMKAHYHLDNLSVHEAFAEDIKFASNSFDMVYIRQAMHHAYDLEKFIAEAGRVLKPGGILFTIRDHVIFNNKDKEWFLEMHPLHKFYGGENAFTADEYKTAMAKAGLDLIEEIKYYDSVINYFPKTKKEIEQMKKRSQIVQSIPNFVLNFFPYRIRKYKTILKEEQIAGRMYSYIARKN